MSKKITSLRSGLKLLIICIVVFLMASNYQPRNVIATSDSSPDLGNISHYNAIIFGDMTAVQADIEGALAVEGNIALGSSIGGYDMGSAGAPFNPYQMGRYDNFNHYPSLLLGGTATHNGISYGKWVNIYNGPAVVKDTYKEEFKNIPLMGFTEDVQGTEENNIREFFNSAKSTIINTTSILQKGNDKTISVDDLKDLSRLTLSEYENEYINTSGIKTLILNVDAYDSINISDMNLPSNILDYDAVIINIPAQSVSFGLGEGGQIGAMRLNGNIVDTEATIHGDPQKNLQVRELAERIIWNFPNATSVSTYRYGILGSVLAPNADLTGDAGSINGMLVASSFMQKGGMEPHAFPIRNIWNWNMNTSRVRIIKTTSNGEVELPSEVLSEMKFTIHNAADEEIAILSTENNFTSSKLTQGTYTIWEDIAPLNYKKLAEPAVHFTVDAQGVITDWSGSDGVVFNKMDFFLLTRVNNDPNPYIDEIHPQIGIHKVDANTKENIPNVKFMLEKENQSGWIEQAYLVSELDGRSKWLDLEEGSYRLSEITPAKDYTNMSDYIKFEIDSNLLLTVTSKPLEVTVQSADSQTLFVIENTLNNPNKSNKQKKPINPQESTKSPFTGDTSQTTLDLLLLSLTFAVIVTLGILYFREE